jgi:tetratricopeptide (TPR) repeat protein
MTNGYAALAIIGLTLGSLPASGQGENTSFNWKFEEANKLMEEKLYNQAADIWSELLATDGENANLSYKLGYSFFHSYNQKSKALPLPWNGLHRHVRRASTAGSIPRATTPSMPRSAMPRWRWITGLGRAYHLNNEFDKADRFYQKFLDEVDEKHALRAASRGKEQTANARLLMADPQILQDPTWAR